MADNKSGRRRSLVVLPLCWALAGCPQAVPGSRPYKPTSSAEKSLLSQAHLEIFPEDVRADPESHRSTLVLWSAIVQRVETSDDGGVVVSFEHHYWDFVEDYSVQKAIAFLSPRGEGNFRATFAPKTTVVPGDMALVYGFAEKVEGDGTIVLNARDLITLRRELYATDVWDYGRTYLVKHDRSDLKILRVPLR